MPGAARGILKKNQFFKEKKFRKAGWPAIIANIYTIHTYIHSTYILLLSIRTTIMLLHVIFDALCMFNPIKAGGSESM